MSKEVSELRAATLVKYDNRAARIDDELEEMTKLCRFQREALQNEVMDGMGYKKEAASEKCVKKTQALALAYTRLVEATIKLEKCRKDIAESMSEEEERVAVVKYLKTLDPVVCKNIWKEVYDGKSAD